MTRVDDELVQILFDPTGILHADLILVDMSLDVLGGCQYRRPTFQTPCGLDAQGLRQTQSLLGSQLK